MNSLNAVIDIKPKKFELTSHLLDESLPKKISGFNALSPKERKSFVESSFSGTGLHIFSLLPSSIKKKWISENHNERYFRLDPQEKILYGCAKTKGGKEIVIFGYDLRTKEKDFSLRELVC